MRQLSTGKNITVNFAEHELCLLEAFDRLRKRTYSSRAGWIKSTIFKSLPEEEKEKVVEVI